MLWALLEVVTTLWPRKEDLRGSFLSGQSKIGPVFLPGQILVNSNPLTQSCSGGGGVGW